jgi:NAD(P)-dependent dehydrogenase (short-subunit alcohol dehydrogenase family)
MEKRLEGKIAWVSGGTSGIGESTTYLFAQEGAVVAVVGRNIEKSRAVVAKIEAAGGQALAIKCDVGLESDVRRSIQETVDRFGGLDILVNNAGMVEIKMLHDYDEAQFDRIMAVNLKSMFFSFKYAYEYLSKKPHSTIVNVGSISTFVGQATTPVYTTSKHAVLGLSRSIALDYAADGIRCNCICPGITDTPMLREHMTTDQAITERLRRSPIAMMVTPQQVARSILYLSCEDSAGVTGTSLTIDNGYLTAAEWDSAGK